MPSAGTCFKRLKASDSIMPTTLSAYALCLPLFQLKCWYWLTGAFQQDFTIREGRLADVAYKRTKDSTWLAPRVNIYSTGGTNLMLCEILL